MGCPRKVKPRSVGDKLQGIENPTRGAKVSAIALGKRLYFNEMACQVSVIL